MSNNLIRINSEDVLKGVKTDSIRNVITLIDNFNYNLLGHYPLKVNVLFAILCVKGTIEGMLSLKRFKVEAPGILIVLNDHIVQYEYFSDDFKAMTIILAPEFWNDFPIDNRLTFPLLNSVKENPSVKLDRQNMDYMITYFNLMQDAIRKVENPNRIEAVRFLTMAFFYGTSYRFFKIAADSEKTKQALLVEKFIGLVRDNYVNHRTVEYYASRLSLSPKYLSKVIKSTSNKSAAEWIEDYVILEAKALLKSSEKTIQQISIDLNFPSQSFFGKYFKRRVGLSPKEYRKSI
ncbi:MAG: AraC family transcriptional regulator [Bacteroidales bacterium]|nr:AraC family transcriptional regulator [Bacteroidales bacterium]